MNVYQLEILNPEAEVLLECLVKLKLIRVQKIEELSEIQKQRIELSIKQLDNGEGISHDAVMKEFSAKLRKAK